MDGFTCIYIRYGSVVKSLPTNAGDVGSITGLGRSPGGGNDNPLQYSCLENYMSRGDWCYSPRSHKESDTTQRLTLLPLHMRSCLVPGTTSSLRTPSFDLIPQHHFLGLKGCLKLQKVPRTLLHPHTLLLSLDSALWVKFWALRCREAAGTEIPIYYRVAK